MAYDFKSALGKVFKKAAKMPVSGSLSEGDMKQMKQMKKKMGMMKGGMYSAIKGVKGANLPGKGSVLMKSK